ncbi:asparagine synthase (glutamine-hydrolyzing) [Singulisphaera sp. PoT]|uniref:asparagine synthase (glutamine-hydrolyzing) n=1 Tax=Singulisphaera sp. PoT TaxID=3411797 RepID=UPI003BF5D904
MCGIGGWIGERTDREATAERMVDSLRHRGPDAHGVWHGSTATLIHTRLSVLDLSEAGAQPMSNEDGTIWTAFNGEIYNHRSLRRQLETRHNFRGHSDTEVIPHLYEEHGPSFVKLLRGMFAIAIFDTRENRLLLARDRFGIKPLFYAANSHGIAFASELWALRRLPDVDTRPDPQALYDFSSLFFIPAPETFYKGIRALGPGEILEAQWGREKTTFATRPYHQWSLTPSTSLNLEDAADRAFELLDTGVEKQLESDVPLGSLLSGGIDSSLVSLAAQAHRGRDPLLTFNVQFPDKDFEETWAAVEVARHIGSTHQTLPMEGESGTWEHVTSLLRHVGQPYADTSFFAAHAVCKLMRKYVTVALSGDGGDEAFGGYNLFWQIARIARLQQLPTPVWNGAQVTLNSLSRLGLISSRLPGRFDQLAGTDDSGIVRDLICFIPDKMHKRLCRDNGFEPVVRHFEPQWNRSLPRKSNRLERLSALATEVNTRLVLPNDFLCKVDMASMREGLEVRVPMLDEDLFDFGLQLPHRLKVRSRTCKLVLREIARRKLPTAVAEKPKRGFGIPIDRWVDRDFRERLRIKLLGKDSPLPDIFHEEIYRPRVEAFCDDRPYPGLSRRHQYQWAIMLLAVVLFSE